MTYEEYLGITAQEYRNAEKKIVKHDDENEAFDSSELACVITSLINGSMEVLVEKNDFDPGAFAFTAMLWGIEIGLLIAEGKTLKKGDDNGIECF